MIAIIDYGAGNLFSVQNALNYLGFENTITHDADTLRKADGLILPDIEAGNLLYKVLPLFAGAKMAGMLKGPQCPVVLSSRADDAETKYRSLCVGIINK